jgi:hypothetical protein
MQWNVIEQRFILNTIACQLNRLEGDNAVAVIATWASAFL